MHEISRRITERMRLRSLAVKLHIPGHVVDSRLGSHKDDLYEATYQALMVWFDDQSDKEQAFEQLCQALTQISERSLITEVLIKQQAPESTASSILT